MRCEQQEEKVYNSPEKKIIDSWVWIHRTGGLHGVDETPESTGLTSPIVFEADGTFLWRTLVDCTITSTFYLGTSMTIFSNDPLPVIYLDSNLVFMYEFSGNDTLDLSENSVDGYNYTYVRD